MCVCVCVCVRVCDTAKSNTIETYFSIFISES